ncbi:hypothetical protein C8R48DRAFT_780341 [Suillus tomentosus]|nr:hypothetical protein C8R48DRAFT_780341 [Suillus tomentosus]
MRGMSLYIAFAAHAVLLSAGESKLAYLLLWCIRAYLKVDRYTALEVHTTKTITAGREALQDFSELMDKYIKKSEAVRPDKNWSFLKKHLVAHLFDDIMAKGATRNTTLCRMKSVTVPSRHHINIGLISKMLHHRFYAQTTGLLFPSSSTVEWMN